MEPKLADAASHGRFEMAADWLQRLDDPQLPQEDLQAWLEWFESSDENRKAFEELQLFRQRFRLLSPPDRAELKHRVDDAPAQTQVVQPTRDRTVFKGVWALAASIGAVAVAVGGWWIAQTHATETYASEENHHRTVVLDDGSSLVLGANSIVDVTYSPTRRSLNIQRGEAYFEVEHNRFRPFTVQAGEVQVTAVGTAFNVQRRSDEVTVKVTEGKVRVTQSEPAAGGGRGAATSKIREAEHVLAVGQQAVLPVAAPVDTRTAATVLPAADWSGDHASFINAPLRDVLPVINRHATTPIAIDDPRVADLTYSGTIFRSHVDEWISSLPQVFPVRAVAMEDGSVTLVSRDTTQP